MSSFTRIVLHWALAKLVSFSPIRRVVPISMYATDDIQPDVMDVTVALSP